MSRWSTRCSLSSASSSPPAISKEASNERSPRAPRRPVAVRRNAVPAARRPRPLPHARHLYPHPGGHQGNHARHAADAPRRRADRARLVDQAAPDRPVRDVHQPPVEPVPRPRRRTVRASRRSPTPTIWPKTEKTSHERARSSHGPGTRRRHDRHGGGGRVHQPARHRRARRRAGQPVRLGPLSPARRPRRGDDRGGDRLRAHHLPLLLRARAHAPGGPLHDHPPRHRARPPRSARRAFFVLFAGYAPDASLNRSALYYAQNTAAETGAQNIVAAIIVTYRGLDTLGEVTVLFLTAAIIGLVLARSARRASPGSGIAALRRAPQYRRAPAGAADRCSSAPMSSSTGT